MSFFMYTLPSLGLDGPKFVILDGPDWHLRSTVSHGEIFNATVPGGVWDNLQRLVGDPRYRDNDRKFINATTGLPGGWTFSKEFAAPPAATLPGALVLLELAGLQGLASVSLNGHALLSTDNMFRLYRTALPAGVLRAKNSLAVSLTAAPAPVPNNGAAPETVRTRDEADAWGWDWSPSLNPMAIVGSVRLVVVTAQTPYLLSCSPKVSVVSVDSETPTEFAVDVTTELLVPALAQDLTGSLVLTGDWGNSTSMSLHIGASGSKGSYP